MLRFSPPGVSGASSAEHDNPGISGRILVVDDDPLSRATHRAILAKQFDVLTAASGSEALNLCKQQLPDLVLLDVEMPELDGYETCRQLRQWTSVPIIFVTAHQSLEEHLKAYDAGGNNLATKPVSSEILLRKVSLAIAQHQAASQLVEEKEAIERMARGFLSSASQSGSLINFMRESIVCQDYERLAREILRATDDLGLQCIVQVRHNDDATAVTHNGELSPLEISILDNAASMGRIFQFKQRLVVNYDRVSIVVKNMPDEIAEPVRSGSLRDSLTVLAETAETFAINVDMRQEAQKRAEALQMGLSTAETALNQLAEDQRTMLLDIRLLLQEQVDEIEKTYGWLGTSQVQEATISSTMEHSVQRILARLASAGDFDSRFAQVISVLHGGQTRNSVELF